MKKEKGCYLFVGMFFILMILTISQKAYAANSKIISLPVVYGGSYKKYFYDLDRDGKKEEIKLLAKNNPKIQIQNEELTIWIQGKKVFDKTYVGACAVDVKLLITGSGKPVFFINAFEFWVIDSGFYEYKNGTMKNIGNVENNYEDNIRSVEVTKITGNRIFVRFVKCAQGIGAISWTTEYDLKKGKWEKKSKVCPTYYENRSEYTKNKWIAKQSFSVYTSVNLKKKKFTMKGNEVFKINKVYTGNPKYVYFQVTRKNGQTGWIKERTAPGKYSYVKNPIYG